MMEEGREGKGGRVIGRCLIIEWDGMRESNYWDVILYAGLEASGFGLIYPLVFIAEEGI